MWPFARTGPAHPPHRRIDDTFAVAGQLLPSQMPAFAALGFRTIVCVRPDGEEFGQPPFAEVAAAATAAGLAAVYIPVSGQLTEGALIRMQQALAGRPGPILGYCRSGARAGALYAAARRAGS